MKKIIFSLFLIILLLVGCAANEEPNAASDSTDPQSLPYPLGEKLEDFTVTTSNGDNITLSEILKEKDMVMINLWATWCSSCRQEMPVINEVYLQYQDSIEILALSIEPEDTPDVLKEFAEKENLSFIFAQDTPDFYNKYNFDFVPMCIIIDRFGTICYVDGIIPEVENFARIFDAFIGDDYTESMLFTSVPPAKPNVTPSTEDELTKALEASAFNLDHKYSWPMLATEKDGRSVVASSNTAVNTSTAEVSVKVKAKKGDAIAFTFKTSTEASMDLLTIEINGKIVKVFGGEHDWTTYAYPVEQDGNYNLTLAYIKDEFGHSGEDTVWVDSVKVLSGQEAADALNANTVYPTAESIELMPTGCEWQEIIFEDKNGTLEYLFPSAKYYIVNADTVTLQAKLTPDADPEAAYFYNIFKNDYFSFSNYVNGDNYELPCKISSVPDSAVPFTAILMGVNHSDIENRIILMFKDEENVETFIEDMELTTWEYASKADNAETGEKGESTYTIQCVDQNGDAVSGVKIQVCDDSSCRIVESDKNGEYILTSKPTAWEIYVLIAPEGYTVADESKTIASPAGGEITLNLKKE